MHCVKSVRIQNYSGTHFSRIWTEYGKTRSISPYSVQMRENAEKMRTRITPNTENFYAVVLILLGINSVVVLNRSSRDVLVNF